MNILWGVILTLLSSIAYIGQVMTAFWPDTAARLGLTEPEKDVDPAFYADVRGEAFWDLAVLWTLPAAGILLLLANPLWAYYGLVGGGMYLYFAGRGIVTRRVMQQREISIGKPESLKVNYVFLSLWGLAAIIAIAMSVAALLLS